MSLPAPSPDAPPPDEPGDAEPPPAQPARSAPWAERLTSRRGLLGGAALLFTVLWFMAWRYFPGKAPIHANDAAGLIRFGVNEAPFLLAAAVVEGFLCAYLTARLHERWPRALDELWRDLRARPERAYVAFGFIGGALALGVGLGLLGGHPITEDEKTYLFQSHLLLQGRLSAPVPPGAAAFWQPFVVMFHGRWSGQYPWGHPALLAPGLLVGIPGLVTALEAGVTVHFTGKLAGEYTKDARAGILAAALASVSPLVVFTGGTLHNANLAAACAAVTLWALVRLSERPGWRGWITLAVATALGLHNRAVDELAIVLGGGAVLLHHHRKDLRGFVRAVGPAVLVSLPLLALHPVINHFAYGHWSRTGYSIFNGNHGWKTMGFGIGPFDEPHTWRIAAAKTVTVLVRVSFYATGSPLGFALVALPCFGLLRRSARAAAPLAPVVLYVTGYFFYAASSIDPTGPVYYLSLMPIVLGWVAMGALDLHDAVCGHAGLGRLVPAFLCAQALAGVAVFWPAQVSYLLDDVRQGSDCEAQLEAAGIKEGLVFVMSGPPREGVPPYATTWHRAPPLAWPPFDAPILFARTLGFKNDLSTVETFARGRPVFLEQCCTARPPSLLRYDPARGTVSTLDGSQETELKRIEGERLEVEGWDAGSASWIDGRDAPPPPVFRAPRVAPSRARELR